MDLHKYLKVQYSKKIGQISLGSLIFLRKLTSLGSILAGEHTQEVIARMEN
ncbi:hypothetical protein P872_16150 [Rhodonellum psychrophilum GCM71 = DSM 17998]|uniref:Uncharacterized protein n=1 Tax=Rhodonellum psychrophilum GCM71 = DSM 17998 TaxID=1123057 RepID=U5BS25_9BACT|nr:hypothetical protein P872_16150 [Rhodonellum psychrophilum GCM71 = DSM 17998]